VTAYDTGNEPGHPTPGVSRHLPVSSTVDAVQVDGLTAGLDGTDPGLPAFDGQRVSRSEYGSANAWLFGSPTATISNPGGGAADITTRQAVDEQGRTVSRTLPAGGTSTTTAATTNKSYYAAAHPDPQCANAAWAGWLCKSSPGDLPSAGFAVPTVGKLRHA
jgi:YD repeat-containing protein